MLSGGGQGGRGKWRFSVGRDCIKLMSRRARRKMSVAVRFPTTSMSLLMLDAVMSTAVRFLTASKGLLLLTLNA